MTKQRTEPKSLGLNSSASHSISYKRREACSRWILSITPTQKRNRVRCYRLLWTNRLAAETKAGRLVQHERGVLRTGPQPETMSAVAEALTALCQIRERQRRSPKRAAA
jgi:hypothetical protein